MEVKKGKPKHSRGEVYQETGGGWRVDFKAGNDILGEKGTKTRPLNETDIHKIFDEIKKRINNEESAAKAKMSVSEAPSNASIVKEGKEAEQVTNDSAAGVKGQVEFLSILYRELWSGVNRKTPDIFVIDAEGEAMLENLDKPGTTTTDVGRSITGNDTVNIGPQFCFAVSESKGAEIAKIFADNGHKIVEHASGNGFQAELGGVRMAFFYAEFENKEEYKEEELPKAA